MTAVVVTCKQCGQEFEPSRDAILRGTWRTCPACRKDAPVTSRDQTVTCCAECGRELRAGGRTICMACLMGSPVL